MRGSDNIYSMTSTLLVTMTKQRRFINENTCNYFLTQKVEKYSLAIEWESCLMLSRITAVKQRMTTPTGAL